MALTASQVRALDREGSHDPALVPDDGALPAQMGTILADIGDSLPVVATADAGGTYTAAEQALINELKTAVNALQGALAALARE